MTPQLSERNSEIETNDGRAFSLVRLKWSVQLKNERSAGEQPYIGLEHIESWTGTLLPTDSAFEPESARRFSEGDVLFGKLRPYLAKVYLAQESGSCSSELLVLKPTAYLNRYLQYLLLERGFLDAVDGSTFGARMPRASWNFIGNVELPVPPLPTQKAIANFLDGKTAAIDALIEKKEKLLELLAEKRSALINQAVTKGLDPNVPMKDSGIPWIGEIPEHWEVLKLALILSDGPRNGLSPAVSNEETGCLSFSLAAIRRGLVDISAETTKHVLASSTDLQKFSIEPGDLLLIRGNGNINLVGYTGLVKGEKYEGFVYPDLLMRMRCNSRAEPAYLRYCLNSDAVRPQLTAAARTTVGTFKVNNEQVRELRVLVPPVVEAKRISQWIDQRCTAFIELWKDLEKQLRLLQEYRQSLITAAVTGQLEIPAEDFETVHAEVDTP